MQITHTSCHIKREVINFPTHEWSWYVSPLEIDKNASKSVCTITMETKTMNNFIKQQHQTMPCHDYDEPT